MERKSVMLQRQIKECRLTVQTNVRISAKICMENFLVDAANAAFHKLFIMNNIIWAKGVNS